MPDHSPVTLATFRVHGGEPAWHFAVASRGPDGPSGPHPGPSPWLILIAGQEARAVRRLLPIWLTNRCLPHVAAQDLAGEALRSPELLRRVRMGNALNDSLARHPEDWAWLKAVVDVMNPDPFWHPDEGDEDDSPFGDPPRRPRRAARSVAPPASAPEPPISTVSTRPLLRRLRAPGS